MSGFEGPAYVLSVAGRPEAEVTFRPVGPLMRLSFVSWPPEMFREPPVFGTPISPVFLPLDEAPPGPVFTGCLAFLGEETW